MDMLFVLNSVMLGIGLAMDAFSVSIANSLNDPAMSHRKMLAIAGVFAGFQALMPMMGWVCVHTVLLYFSSVHKYIPWIALLLLGYLGGKMIIDGVRKKNADVALPAVGVGMLLVQGVATSIDALSVGFTIAEYGWVMALTCSLIIAAVTFAICMCGLLLGKKFGTLLSDLAPIFGGVILIAIGIEIVLNNIL